eukprot:CAMPEP_0197027184 /NCGR_PEP_ID=MMETSP1384-20130603/7131_1 /TAXON_ID=29189 /ORGANISM="Ammonia sp." /LENGTH=869 /DNA_ID=CAMNT_0042455987 /DNA_START=45 /DNA_END=2654 /DNA_ORIENTATION=+
MSGLSREVLKWIQGLDLSYSVRNVRRDFSNGFMFAEILSRYYPHDLEMHSFNNGSNNQTKLDNWHQLKKFFKKINFHYNEEEIAQIIKCDPNSALTVKAFINRLYEAITNKKLRQIDLDESAKSKATRNVVPPYAFSTASKTVTEQLRGTDIKTSDIQETQQLAQTVISQHQRLQLEQKKLRGPLLTTGSRKKRSPHLLVSSSVKNNNEAENVSFIKDVEVKKVNESLLTLRNLAATDNYHSNHHSHDHEAAMMNTQSASQHYTLNETQTATVDAHRMPHRQQVTATETVDEIFGNCVQFCIQNDIIDADLFEFYSAEEDADGVDENYASTARKKDLLGMFFNLLQDANANVDNKLIGVIECMHTEFVAQFCESAVCSPKQFWKMMHVFCKGFEILDESSVAFSKWLVFAMQFANTLSSSNGAGDIFDLFSDFGLKAFVSMLSSFPLKRKPIFEFISLFLGNPSNGGEHETIVFLKRLQKELESMDKFVECCAMFIETQQNEIMSERLMDVYIYYSVCGLNHCSPKTRASALSILCSVLQQLNTNENVQDLVSKTFENNIMNMAGQNNAWWEIDANLIILCCQFLSRYNYRHPICSQVYVTLNRVLSLDRDLCPKIVKIAVYYLSSVIGEHKAIYALFTNLLLKYDSIRASLLANKQFVQYITLSYGQVLQIECVCVQNAWQGWIPCLCVADLMKQSNLGNLSPTHLEVILAIIGHLDGDGDGGAFPLEQSLEWKQVFLELKDYLLVELCDPSLCRSISQCLLKFIFDRNISEEAITLLMPSHDAEKSITAPPPLFGVIKLIFDDANSPRVCQENLCEFLTKLLSDARFEKMTKNLLQMFYLKYPIPFSQSLLSNFMDQISVQQPAPST